MLDLDPTSILAGFQVFLWLFFIAMLALSAYLVLVYGRDTYGRATGSRDRANTRISNEPQRMPDERQQDQAA